MRVLRLAMIFGCIAMFATSLLAFPKGDIEKGKALFCDQAFAGATTGKSCSSCHVNGKGLAKEGDKTEWRIMGKRYKNIEDAVNYMIETALHGKAIDPRSDEMVHIAAYIKSL